MPAGSKSDTVPFRRQLEAEQSAMEQEITNFKRDAAWLEQYTQEDAVTSTKGALKTTFQARQATQSPHHTQLSNFAELLSLVVL